MTFRALTILTVLALPMLAIAQTTQPTIRLTEEAARQITETARGEKLKNWVVRIGIKPGDDKGNYVYSLDVTEEAPRANDEVVVSLNVRITVDKNDIPKLKGTTLDFQDDNANRGFVFKNPNVPNN